MERMGILEMDAVQEQEVLQVSKKVDKKRFAFDTMVDNNFYAIPEGFTGVYFRDEPYQIVPDDLLDKIKALSTGGFEAIPEDHELHLLADMYTEKGKDLAEMVLGLMYRWFADNF